MKVEDYTQAIGKTSKLKAFICLLIFAVARITLIPFSVRTVLFRLAGVKVGKDTGICSGIKLSDPANAHYIEIGNRVGIAEGVYFINSSGPRKSELIKLYPRIIGKIQIDDDVWIGTNAIILPGVHIGKKSIVGAGSVVTKDVGENVVVAGNPAKVIKTLTDSEGRL